MPAPSKAEQRLMGAAEHGGDFPMAKKLRKSMTHDQLHDFASGSMKGKPEHVQKKKRGGLVGRYAQAYPQSQGGFSVQAPQGYCMGGKVK